MGAAVRRSRAVAVATASIVALAAPAGVLAHGDPGSHYLESEPLYPGFANRPSQAVELRLLGLLQASGGAGFPVKVVLLGGAADVVDEPAMLRQPQRYASRVAGELGAATPVVVVSSYGVGVSGADRAAAGPIGAAPRTGDELARTAIVVVRRLALAAGHTLPARVRPAAPLSAATAGAESRSLDVALPIVLVLFATVLPLAFLANEARLRLSGRRQPTVEGGA